MLRGRHKTYDKLYIYIFKNFHPALRELEDEDLIGVWEEDGVGVLFFHSPRDELVNRVIQKYGLELEEKDVVPYSEWMENRFPKPIRVGDLNIAPVWIKGDWDIVLDPSVVFGEGRHPTTSMVLQMCWEFFKENGLPEFVVDMGCGTGVLSLFWAKLGSRVLAVDKNPLCVEVTKHNAQLNSLKDKIQVIHEDVKGVLPIKADLIVANLFKAILIELFGLPSFWSSPYYIVSGFSPAMEDELKASLSAFNVEIVKRKELDGWVSWLIKNKEPLE